MTFHKSSPQHFWQPSSDPQAEAKLEVIPFGPVSHQDIINAFAQSAGELGLADPWQLLTRAGLSVHSLAENRFAAYTGTPLHELPNLSVAERNLLMRRLAHVLATMPVPPVSTPDASATHPANPSTPTPVRGNRLGFYLHLSTDQDGLWEAIRQVQPPVILVHADTLNRMLLREIRSFRAPNALVIARLYKDNNAQRLMLASDDPAAQGRAMADEILNLDFGLATERGANGRLLIDAWMSLNEAVPGPASRQFAEEPVATASMLHAYDLFQVAFRLRLQEAGVEAVAFNFGAGNFNLPEHYLDHFPNTLANYTYLGFHEYGWPTLYPAAGSATSAGLYRVCMAGIRARFGPRHLVIITEAGLTRMYQDVSAGDVGWLNTEQSLSQDEYWQTLQWYNQYLLADDYALGACLYEVGHHGDWLTFRHLGKDNAGQPLRLMERVAALNGGTSRGRSASVSSGGTSGRSSPRKLPEATTSAPSTSAPSSDTTSRGRSSRSAARFVRIQGGEFVVENKTLRFIGVNIRGLVHYGDGRSLPYTNLEHAREQIRAARAMGARVIRLFLPNIHIDVPTTIARLHTTIELLQQEAPDLYLLPALSNLYHDVDFRVRGDDRFYEQVDPNFPIKLLNAAFYQHGFRENFLPFVQQVAQTFRDEPAIFAWEIGNELKLNPVTGDVESDPNIAMFLDFMHTVAQEIRRLAPHHLRTTGMISTRHASLNKPALREKLYAGSDFDFLTVHCYNDEYENDDSELARSLNKPFIIEEAGYGANFNGNRPIKMQDDMSRWFSKGARGYMPWGFMATNQDIGDGDRDSGLDRTLHGDWDALFNLLRSRAEELARAATSALVQTFQPGQTVYSADWLNVRRTPGYLNKLGDDVLGMVTPDAPILVQGTVVSQDALLWWPVQTTLSDGQSVTGWVAEANATTRLLTTQKPRGSLRGAAATPTRPRGRGMARGSQFVGEARYAADWINLRFTPGYVGKPSNDVQGQIPYGAKVELTGGPVTTDELNWWAVRTPLSDNRVATGWAAEMSANGVQLLVLTPPSPPPALVGDVHGPIIQQGTLLTLLGTTQLYSALPLASTPLSAQPTVQATFLRNATMTVISGPTVDATLEWWQIAQTTDSLPISIGWTPITSADGTRLFATSEVAANIHVGLPFAQPHSITRDWGVLPDFYKKFVYDGVPLKGHNGIDFDTDMSTPLLAVDDGEVLRVDFEEGGFGHFVILRHNWGESLYAHMERVDVPFGATLREGQSIGLSGNSGGSTGPHLHFGIRIFPYRRTDGWGGFVNPLPFMRLVDLPFRRAPQRMPAPMAPELPGRLRP